MRILTRSRCSQLAACALVLLGLAGCYERVVGAKGMGAQGVSVHQANSPEPARKATVTKQNSVRLKDATTTR